MHPRLAYRRGVSELVGALLALIIITSLLASAIITSKNLEESIRESARKASARLIEASNPPNLVLYTQGSSLYAKLGSNTTTIEKILILYENSTILEKKPTTELYTNGQLLLDTYNCEKIKVVIVTSLGNMFTYPKKGYYTCNTQPGNPGGFTIPQTSLTINPINLYTQNVDIATITNVNPNKIQFNLKITYYEGRCQAKATRGSDKSVASRGSQGIQVGEPPLQYTLNGINVEVRPVVYMEDIGASRECIYAIYIHTPAETVFRANIEITGQLSVSPKVYNELVRDNPAIAGALYAPSIYYTMSTVSVQDPDNGAPSTIYITGNRVWIDEFLGIFYTRLGEYMWGTISLDVTITVNRMLVLQSNIPESSTILLEGGSMYKIYDVSVDGCIYDIECLFLELSWKLTSLESVKLVFDTPQGLIERSPTQDWTIAPESASVQVQAYPELQLIQEYAIQSIRIWKDQPGQVTVTTTGGDAITLPAPIPIIEVQSLNRTTLLVIGVGPQPQLNTVFNVLDPLYNTQTTLILVDASKDLARIDVSRHHVASPGNKIPPGIYIASEPETISGVNIGKTMVILAP